MAVVEPSANAMPFDHLGPALGKRMANRSRFFEVTLQDGQHAPHESDLNRTTMAPIYYVANDEYSHFNLVLGRSSVPLGRTPDIRYQNQVSHVPSEYNTASETGELLHGFD